MEFELADYEARVGRESAEEDQEDEAGDEAEGGESGREGEDAEGDGSAIMTMPACLEKEISFRESGGRRDGTVVIGVIQCKLTTMPYFDIEHLPRFRERKCLAAHDQLYQQFWVQNCSMRLHYSSQCPCLPCMYPASRWS